jgi:hypothetical protein
LSRTGCGVPRACFAGSTREAPGNTALPPLRAERANAPMRDRRASPDEIAKAGPGVNNRRRGAPRGERPTSLGARRAFTPAGLRDWPAKGASQAPERLSALRPLAHAGGKEHANLGDVVSREKDKVCPRFVGWAKARTSRSCFTIRVTQRRAHHGHRLCHHDGGHGAGSLLL